MGRKKRKLVDDSVDEGPPLEDMPMSVPSAKDPRRQNSVSPPPPPPLPPPPPAVIENLKEGKPVDDSSSKPLKSGYAMTSHSAEVIDEDIYVSAGSDDEDEEDIVLRNVDMVLAGSRMGIMRRGIHHTLLLQPNRQWVKEDTTTKTLIEGDDRAELDEEEAEKKRLKEQEEELAKLDPAQRAARLLAEKQRKLEEAKVTARRVESEENAGRDPCLFSKRTAFDIRFDQIDDKPWTRGDITDYFNYGLTEEDWLEYAQQQLMIRQELTDATRQRRPPDPAIVPVTPKTPSKQTPKVAVLMKSVDEENAGNENDGTEQRELGPVLVKKEDPEEKEAGQGPDKPETKIDIPIGAGGAWGAGAAPGSMLAKLIEEQEQMESGATISADGPPTEMEIDSKYGPAGDVSNDDRSQADYNQADDFGSVRSGQSSHHERNSSYGESQYGGKEHYDHYGGGGGGHRGGRGGGRSQYGGRGGRGGRVGGYRDRSYQGRGGSGRGGVGGYDGGGGGDYYGKRSRDEYSSRSGGGGSWRR